MKPLQKNHLFLYLFLFLLPALSLAAPSSEYWPIWDQANNSNKDSIDHDRWQQFLSEYLVEDAQGTHLVRYGAVTDIDRETLSNYLNDLSALNPLNYHRDEQMAYWINLYNALTVQLILDNYPVDSIRDLGGFFKFGPWDDELIVVNGTELSLNDIEHRILRPIWQDKRIHYAVNCASIGCPNLLATAYTAEQLEAQLEHATKNFINQEKAVRLVRGKLTLSSIYDWYAEDFGTMDELKLHLLTYLGADKRSRLEKHQGKPDYSYDWKLNGAE